MKTYRINRRRVVDQMIYVRAASYAEALALAKSPPAETGRRRPTVSTADEQTRSTTYRSLGVETA